MMSDERPKIKPNLIWRVLQEETVVVSPIDGRYCVFNGSGSTIWGLLTENSSLAEIEAHLVANYEVNPEVAREDIGRFLSELQERGLLAEES